MKRLTDTKKWDIWFRKLSPSYKSLWSYLYDHCGPGGVWDRDDDVAILFVNDPSLDLDDFLLKANEGKERIKVLKDGRKWFIVDFVAVQCPTGLKRYTKNGEVNRVHAPIYLELEKYGICCTNYELTGSRGSTEPLERLLDKEQDKVKDIKGIVKGGRFSPPSLEELRAAFSEKGFACSEAEKFMAYFESVGWVVGSSRKPMKNWRGAVATWCGKLRDSGVRPKVIQKQEVETPQEPEVILSDEERKILIRAALPSYGKSIN